MLCHWLVRRYDTPVVMGGIFIFLYVVFKGNVDRLTDVKDGAYFLLIFVFVRNWR